MLGVISAWWLVLIAPTTITLAEPSRILAAIPAASEAECRLLEDQARGSAGPTRFWACIRDERFAR